MTDTEKKIAEIREALEKATPGPWTKFENRIHGKAQPAVEPIICEFYEEETERDRNNAHLIANAPDWLRFLLSEYERSEKFRSWAYENIDRLQTELDQKDEENRKLRKELDKQVEIGFSFECQLQSAQQEIEALRQERNKLIEGLRWYAGDQYGSVRFWPPIPDIPILHDCGQRARDILREVGVTAE